MTDISESEVFAADVLARGDKVSGADVYGWLQLVQFPASGRSINESGTQGFVVGCSRTGPFCNFGRHSDTNRMGVKLLLQNATDNQIDMPFNSIQLNRGRNPLPEAVPFQRAHVDQNSAKGFLQAVRTYGCFKGGEIAVCPYPPPPMTSVEPVPQSTDQILLTVPPSGPVGSYATSVACAC